MANRIVKIKDICHVIKGETGITKAIPGDYPMVTLAEERKTHNEFQFDCKAVIIPLVSSTGHGHASMKRIHFQEGKFALGSILCALVPKKEKEYVPEYLYHILDMGKERIFVPLMKGMANVSLPMNRIKDVEINLPPYEEQLRLAEIYQEVSKNIDLLKNETIKQKDYIPKLRQSILQMAVQGKLTAKWREENPEVEPASVLLEKIKTEKEQLIKEGKIKRQKTMPEISDEEKPYKVPITWLFSRMQCIIDVRDGTHDTPKYQNQGIPLVTSKNLSTGRLNISDVKLISKEDHLEISKRSKVDEGDILFAMIGTIGNPVLINNIEFEFSIKNVALFKQFNYSLFNSEYLLFFLKYISNYLNDNSRGAIQKFVSLKLLRETLIPVPPIEEQKAIVSKVKQLMSWCDELEKKIEKRDVYQEKMMQAVVKQAFKKDVELME